MMLRLWYICWVSAIVGIYRYSRGFTNCSEMVSYFHDKIENQRWLWDDKPWASVCSMIESLTVQAFDRI